MGTYQDILLALVPWHQLYTGRSSIGFLVPHQMLEFEQKESFLRFETLQTFGHLDVELIKVVLKFSFWHSKCHLFVPKYGYFWHLYVPRNGTWNENLRTTFIIKGIWPRLLVIPSYCLPHSQTPVKAKLCDNLKVWPDNGGYLQGAPKKMSHSDFQLKSVPEVRLYFFTCVSESEFRARSI